MDVKIVRNFYRDPDDIRKRALESKYELISSGNYIGHDTIDRGVNFPELETRLRELFPEDYYRVVCSRFRSAIDGDTHLSWIHSDSNERKAGWHVLVYLSKQHPEDGITLYDHDTYGTTTDIWVPSLTKDTENTEIFRPVKTIPYEYNTAVILDYSQFHSSVGHSGFGDDITTSRLMHIIEICDVRSAHYKYRISRPGACVPADDDPYSRK